MGKTYTDFSQLSRGMFRKSDPVVELCLAQSRRGAERRDGSDGK